MLGQGVRLPWDEVPAGMRDAVAVLAGAPVVAATPCAGGFSPGVAARLDLAGGGVVFVKAVSGAQNPRSRDMYRVEVAVNGWLPHHPSLPRLLGAHDDGEWVALVFELADGTLPALPWVPEELAAVLDALRSVQRAATPAPDAAPSVGDLYAEDFAAFRDLAGAAAAPAGLDPWTLRHLDRLAALEAGWADAAVGDTLLHCDLRADNVLVRDGHAWLLDWAWACRGAGWVDGVLFAPSVALQGGPPAADVLAAAYPDAPRDGVVAVLTALTGFFTAAALRPAPPGLPTLRAHQESSRQACVAWLAPLLGG